MNDPRGVLEEFVRACDGFRDSREARYDGVGRMLDAESRRIAYRENQKREGRCIYCPRPADPETNGKKTVMCTKHLTYYRDYARERARSKA